MNKSLPGLLRDLLFDDIVEVMLEYQPQTPGSYPPRLINLVNSVWLQEGCEFSLIDNRLAVQRHEDKCFLIPLNGAQHDILVNKQPLVIKRQLKDGDFIQHHQSRMIFQQDPADDRYKRFAKEEITPVTLKTDRYFRKAVQYTKTTISFDGGEHFARWDEITYVHLIKDIQSGSAMAEIAIIHDNQIQILPTKLKNISYRQLGNVFLLLATLTPVDLNLQEFGISVRQEFPDAYFAAAYEKIYIPVQLHQRVAPADMDFIMDYTPAYRSFLKANAIAWGLALAFSAIFAFITAAYVSFGAISMISPEFFELFLKLFNILFMSIAVFLFIINLPFLVLLIRNFKTKWQNRNSEV